MSRPITLELRTTDVDGARAYYLHVLGRPLARVTLLGPELVARGARPHWLGYVTVADVEASASSLVVRGAMRLGPTRATSWGASAALVRDPGGALLAVVSAGPADDAGPTPTWQVLNTPDVPRALEDYAAVFGWVHVRTVALGELGEVHELAYAAGAPEFGAVVSSLRQPGIHPHWVYFHDVEALPTALARVREAGGTITGTWTLPDGASVAVAEDAQGATLGLWAR
jgi:predicted enzyme related to lactoylglutathione lyase